MQKRFEYSFQFSGLRPKPIGVWLRRLASVFRFCQRDGTRNGTRSFVANPFHGDLSDRFAIEEKNGWFVRAHCD
jgi:hypothetical protein